MINSLINIPSVIYFNIVFSDVLSSNLIEYPIYYPIRVSVSYDTLFATDIAAILLGYVIAIYFYEYFVCNKNYGIYVVLPEPVSPYIIKISLVSKYSKNSFFLLYAGNSLLFLRI